MNEVNFNEVRKNAKLQGVPLSEIAIIYENLTKHEINALEEHCLLAHKNDDKVIGRFMEDGRVMFPEKAVGVYSLAS